MASDREIALEQALVAVLGSARERGIDLDDLSAEAKHLVLDNTKYRHVEHPHVTNACNAIDDAIGVVARA
ncbi:hypothetical protein [Stutzerimonas nitrititolerans]|uniref:hypothetical protein n=1 Tax=Stutzerimonas nitrititolerans TaxID=2482751 RepID=UPI0028A017AD|nr:hypothetical protein [Stutzerimonas nitrititolerans]